MFTPRRVYIFLVSGLSLNAVAWAAIALLRNLLVSGLDPEPVATAFQIAVLVIVLPVYVIHWIWAQRLARDSAEERQAVLRRAYLYGVMAAFLGPFVSNAHAFIRALLNVWAGETASNLSPALTPGAAMGFHLVALILLAMLWIYHQRVLAEERGPGPETGPFAVINRLYLLGFSAAGLTMATLAAIHLIRWLLLQFATQNLIGTGLTVELNNEVARMAAGLPLWLLFWGRAQRLFQGPQQEERDSALRKLYLYGAVWVGALAVVANSTAILAGLFRRLLALPSLADARLPVPVIIGTAFLWAYHANVLREDAKQAGETPRQAGVRRLYLYLIAAIGLAAVLTGVSGILSVIIRSVESSFGTALREQSAWFSAAALVGMPVWILPWRAVQQAAAEDSPAGADERRSIVRMIYLYFFLFIATAAAISGAVFIVFQLVSAVLGEDAPTLSELGQPVAYILIAAGVWIYHGMLLTADRRLTLQEQTARINAQGISIVDLPGGSFGQALASELKTEFPELDLTPLILADGPGTVLSAGLPADTVAALQNARLIVGPWTILSPAVSQETAAAVQKSSAQKLLAPTWDPDMTWIGLEQTLPERMVAEAVAAVTQFLEQGEMRPSRQLGVGGVLGVIAGILVLLFLLISVGVRFFEPYFF